MAQKQSQQTPTQSHNSQPRKPLTAGWKLPDPDDLNNSRADWAEAAAEAFAAQTGQDAEADGLQEIIGDLLADLAHLCDREGLSMRAMLRNAAGHYAAETESQGQQFTEVA